MTEKTYAVGDEFGGGTVTRVGTNNGHPEYTVAVEDKTNERPIDIGPRVHPAAFTTGPVELAEENQKTYDAVKEEAEKATAEAEKANAEANEKAVADSGDNTLSDEAKSKPADEKTPVTNSVTTKATGTPKTVAGK